MVQANCIRIHSHSNSDRHELYRSDDERNYAQEYDPLAKFKRMLIRYERFTPEELETIENEAKAELKEAHKLALKAPDPDPNTYLDFVLPEPYISQKYPEGTHQETGEKKKLITALNETLKAEFRLNPDTFIWGQDMANKDKGGIFNVSKGLQQEFGSKRVFNAPIAEDFIVGTANGMSRYSEKIRIVIEGAEFADYFWPAMEQYVDSSHDYWRSNGKFTPNVTIRLASGGYIGGGLYHSQNIEGALTSIPGVRIVYPSFADDAAGLLRTAIRSKGLTMFMEPKALYNDPKAATVIPDDFEVPFGKARIRRTGDDLVMITYGNTTHMCIEAAERLSKEGASVEVIDLRSLIPLDKETILSSVKRIGKVMVVHEDKVHSGFGAEITSMIMEEAFEYLDCPVKRVGSSFTPVGFHRSFERMILPNTEKIYKTAKEILAY
jgi:2-oxoisovalerate dehydrogenase E1 component